MAQKSKRKRRATLRGWWKVLPFMVCPTILLMTFARWEAGRLQNQYRRGEQLEAIRELRKENRVSSRSGSGIESHLRDGPEGAGLGAG